MRVLVLSLMLLVAACGSSTENGPDPDGASDTNTAAAADGDEASERLEQIAAEVDAWASSTLDEAKTHAEAAANLVVGPGGLDYGDRDGDGEIGGDVPEGLLPCPEGVPVGIVGWATLTQSGTFEEAIEYSGHADLHVDVSRDALARC